MLSLDCWCTWTTPWAGRSIVAPANPTRYNARWLPFLMTKLLRASTRSLFWPYSFDATGNTMENRSPRCLIALRRSSGSKWSDQTRCTSDGCDRECQ